MRPKPVARTEGGGGGESEDDGAEANQPTDGVIEVEPTEVGGESLEALLADSVGGGEGAGLGRAGEAARRDCVGEWLVCSLC